MTKGSLRKALASKQRRTATYLVPVKDATEAEKALTEAQQAHRLAVLRHDDGAPETVETAKAVTAARAAVDACYYPIRLQNVSPAEFEALLSAHEPTEQQVKDAEAKKQNRPHFDVDSLIPALVAACSVEQDMTAEEWADELNSERWSAAERNELFDAAMSVNTQGRSQSIPFG